jgi:hypothetical protein
MLNNIFWALMKRAPLFQLGDGGVARVVRDMERAVEPPFFRRIGTPGERRFGNKFALTEAGRAVLNGTRDWQSLNPPPRWVGGVHVQPGVQGWRWDEVNRDAVFRR